MAADHLDEDGRCVLTGLKPEECGCTRHRNSETAARLDGVVFDRYVDAIYDGPCALSAEHKIEAGDRIGHTQHGWACNRCVRDAKRIPPRVRP